MSDLFNPSRYCEVAVNFPIGNGILTYAYENEIQRGELIEVPLGRRKAKAVF